MRPVTYGGPLQGSSNQISALLLFEHCSNDIVLCALERSNFVQLCDKK